MRRCNLRLVFTMAASLTSSFVQAQTAGPAPARAAVIYADQHCATGHSYDDTCINRAIQAAAIGATVYLTPPDTTWLISKPIIVDREGIRIEGISSSAYTNSGPGPSPSTRLYSALKATDSVVLFTAKPGGGNQKRGGLANLFIDCRGTAGYGVRLLSANWGEFRNLQIHNCTEAAINLKPAAINLQEFRDVQFNTFDNISVREFEAPGNCVLLQGDRGANSSYNTFRNIRCGHADGDGFLLQNDDNNRFFQIQAERARGGKGIGVHFTTMKDGANVNDSAREEAFYGLDSGGGGIVQDGFSTANVIFGLFRGNGAPMPTILSGRMAITDDGLAGFGWKLPNYTFQELNASAPNGSILYCSDCLDAHVCIGGGAGAVAKRLHNTWICN